MKWESSGKIASQIVFIDFSPNYYFCLAKLIQLFRSQISTAEIMIVAANTQFLKYSQSHKAATQANVRKTRGMQTSIFSPDNCMF